MGFIKNLPTIASHGSLYNSGTAKARRQTLNFKLGGRRADWGGGPFLRILN